MFGKLWSARGNSMTLGKNPVGRQTLRGGGYKYEPGPSAGAIHTAMKGNHDYDYDYLCIGGGSGGVRSSRIAAGHGAKVALVECAAGGSQKENGFGGLGGTCVNVGCVPKKLMVYGSHYSHDMHDAENYGSQFTRFTSTKVKILTLMRLPGWEGANPTLNWKRFIDNKNKEIKRLNGIYGPNSTSFNDL